MNDVKELLRLPSPAPRPQPLAFDGERLWMGSWDTMRLYAIDVNQWRVSEEAAAPGKPFGMTVVGDELRVVVAVDEDDRYIYRFVPGRGFKADDRIACPDLTGSQLGYDGETLFVSQLGNKRILELDESGGVRRTIDVGRKICGQVVIDGCFHLLTGDDEMDSVELTRVDARGEKPVVTAVARVPFDARALTYDGTRYWSSDREKNEIVAFEVG